LEPADEANGMTAHSKAPDARRASAEIVRLHHPVVSEFQSDAVELEEREPPRIAYLSLYLTTALIAAAIVWACLSQVDKIVVARGKLITTQPNLVVQALETSVIRSVQVAAGDVVKKGQVLARLDPTFTQSDVDQLQTKISALDAKSRRLEAELGNREFELRKIASNADELEGQLFKQRKAYFSSQVENLEQQIQQAQADFNTNLGEKSVLEKRLEGLREIEQMRSTLFEHQTGSRLNLLSTVDTRLQIEGDLARLDGSQIELDHRIAKARAEKQSFIEDFKRTTLEQLVDTREKLSSAIDDLKKAKLRQNMVVLSSPADAVVLEVAQRSIGSVVREAEPIFTLVPLDVPLEAEVAIEASDIGQVKVGQEVRIKFDTFPFQEHGVALGKVRNISQDSFSPGTQRDLIEKLQSQAPYFRARVELINTKLRGIPADFRLSPGTSLTAEIKQGKRSVISYFLHPLIRGLDESIREP
jgi:hemolysin D